MISPSTGTFMCFPPGVHCTASSRAFATTSREGPTRGRRGFGLDRLGRVGWDETHFTNWDGIWVEWDLMEISQIMWNYPI